MTRTRGCFHCCSTGAGQTRWISDYHGDSRTVYVGGSPWGVVPDATSKYKIYYSSEVVEYHSGAKLAVATYPRPVKQGYLVEFAWYECARDVPASFLNNAWTDSLTADGVADENHGANQAVSLPECKGSLGMRKPKQARPMCTARQGAPDRLRRGTAHRQHFNDAHHARLPGRNRARRARWPEDPGPPGKAHYRSTRPSPQTCTQLVLARRGCGRRVWRSATPILADAAALTTLTNGGLVAGSFIKVNAQEYMQWSASLSGHSR